MAGFNQQKLGVRNKKDSILHFCGYGFDGDCHREGSGLAIIQTRQWKVGKNNGKWKVENRKWKVKNNGDNFFDHEGHEEHEEKQASS